MLSRARRKPHQRHVGRPIRQSKIQCSLRLLYVAYQHCVAEWGYGRARRTARHASANLFCVLWDGCGRHRRPRASGPRRWLIDAVAPAGIDLDTPISHNDCADAMIPETENADRRRPHSCDEVAGAGRNGHGIFDPTRTIVRRERRFEFTVGNGRNDRFGTRRSDLKRSARTRFFKFEASQHRPSASAARARSYAVARLAAARSRGAGRPTAVTFRESSA